MQIHETYNAVYNRFKKQDGTIYPNEFISVSYFELENYEDSDGYNYIQIYYSIGGDIVINRKLKVDCQSIAEYSWKLCGKNLIKTHYSWDDFKEQFVKDGWYVTFIKAYYKKYSKAA